MSDFTRRMFIKILKFSLLFGRIVFDSLMLIFQQSGGHAQTVNDVCFHMSQPELFTCSDDGHVICWDLTKGQVKQ